MLRRSLADPAPDLPLRLASSVHRTAVDDAAAAAADLPTTLTGAASRRAVAHVSNEAGGGEARTAILEHWYQRCYLATARAQLGVLQPLQAVTTAEAREVTVSVELGQA